MTLVASAAEKPAGFWRRSAAWGLDWLLLSPLLYEALRPQWSAAFMHYQALRAQLEDWVFARALPAGSLLDLWLALSTSALADTSLQTQVTADVLQLGTQVTETLILASLLAALYFITFEASTWQATPGKRAFGLRVIAINKASLSWSRAALRYLAGSLSWLTLNLGHAMAAFRRDGRALHDLIAGTAVMQRDTGSEAT